MKKLLCAVVSIVAWGTTFGITQINISPKGSDSSGDGSAVNPFASFARAIDEFKKGTSGEFEIKVAEGEYFFDDGLIVREADLINKKLSIVGQIGKDGALPKLVGGKKINALKLEKVTDKSVLSKIPSDAEGTLFFLDLKKNGINNFGTYRQRGYAVRQGSLEMEAFLGDKPLRLAQYPNDESKIPIGKVLDKGLQRAIALGQGAYKPAPDKHVRGATFHYDSPRVERWLNAPEARVFGFLSVGWAHDEIEIKEIDVEKKTITLKSPHVYGVFSNERSKVPIANPADKAQNSDLCMRGYRVRNLIEEIDQNGEYFIDRQTGVFYVMLAQQPSENDNFYFSVMENPFFYFSNGKDILIKNLDFCVSRATAIRTSNCDDVSIKNCKIYNCAKAISIEGLTLSGALGGKRIAPKQKLPISSKNIKISDCKIFNIAYGAVGLDSGDRRTLEKSNSSIENCEFFDNGRVVPCSSPAVTLDGVAIKVANCEFRNHPHITLRHRGNDCVIERNIFTNCCKNSSDMGIIYTGRNPSMQGNVIRNNFFSQNLASHKEAMMCGVYVDDGSAGQLIEGNVFCRTGNMGRSAAFGAIYVHGGGDNIGRGNVFIECQSAMSQQTWKDEKFDELIAREKNKYYKDIDVTSEVYQKRYPKLKDQLTGAYPRRNTAENNRVYNTSLSMNGDMILIKNRCLELNDGVSAKEITDLKIWTIDDVKKFFGDDNVVKRAFSKKIGIIRK